MKTNKATDRQHTGCHMRDGFRAIEPAKVVDLMDGVWIFDNGYASNCEVKK